MLKKVSVKIGLEEKSKHQVETSIFISFVHKLNIKYSVQQTTKIKIYVFYCAS